MVSIYRYRGSLDIFPKKQPSWHNRYHWRVLNIKQKTYLNILCVSNVQDRYMFIAFCREYKTRWHIGSRFGRFHLEHVCQCIVRYQIVWHTQENIMTLEYGLECTAYDFLQTRHGILWLRQEQMQVQRVEWIPFAVRIGFLGPGFPVGWIRARHIRIVIKTG